MKNAPAFAFDMMEPERPKVDRAVLTFLKSEALHPSDFTIREDGVVRLNPELGLSVSTDVPDEVLELMSLYPQPVRAQGGGVEYLPVPRQRDPLPRERTRRNA